MLEPKIGQLQASISLVARRSGIRTLSTIPRFHPRQSAISAPSRPTPPALDQSFSASRAMASTSNAAGPPEALASYDKELVDIADYVHDYTITSPLAYDTARYVLLDTLGCGLEALSFPPCTSLLGPTIPGTSVPNGCRVPGTAYTLDPISGAFNIGAMIRWLDYNDCWLAAEWGHPSDNLGGILAVADWLTRTAKSGVGDRLGQELGVKVRKWKVRDVLEAMIKAHEIQGVLALENSFNKAGLDHVVLVKVATAATVSKLLGLTRQRTTDVVSQAWVDGQSLRTYRHAPNTMSRKSWAAGDACQRAVTLALRVARGEKGVPTVLSAKTWGFYDVLFKGEKFKFQREYGSYVMENVLFKVSYPAEFHSQTAIEAAKKIHATLRARGKSAEDIQEVVCRTHEACVRIIDKQHELLTNFADRDHCIQYMVAVMLVYDRLTANDYLDDSDAARSDLIESLRRRIRCVEDEAFTRDYHDPAKRTIANALTVELKDGTKLKEVMVEAPLGHRLRREEAKPEILAKYERHLMGRYGKDADGEPRVKKLVQVGLDEKKLLDLDVDDYVDMYYTG